MGTREQGAYPSDVSDEEWAFVLLYLLLCREDSLQRQARSAGGVQRGALCGAYRRAGAVSAQRPAAVVRGLSTEQRWQRAGCLEMLVEDVRSLLRE